MHILNSVFFFLSDISDSFHVLITAYSQVSGKYNPYNSSQTLHQLVPARLENRHESERVTNSTVISTHHHPTNSEVKTSLIICLLRDDNFKFVFTPSDSLFDKDAV